MTRRRARPFLILCLSAGPCVLQAQQPAPQAAPPQTLTLAQAMQYASDHYPAIRAALEQVTASAAGVDVARAASFPRLDALWQSNRGTANNIVGQLLPQSTIPGLSGPVLPAASNQSVWGSATGALFSWEPFDFGLRQAGVSSAEAALTQARAGETLTRLEVQSAVGAAFLDVVAAQQGVTATRADLARRDILLQSVQTLVRTQLRPGADQSRAEAERAAAQTRVLQAQQALAIAQATLTRVLGSTSGPVTVVPDALLTRLPASDIAPADAAAHPLAQARQAGVDEARAQEKVLARTDSPRVFVESSVFARGSGASPSGSLNGGVEGLGLDRTNWAAGVQIIFPNVFDVSSLRARKAAAAAISRANVAQYDEALLTITNQQQTAEAVLLTARAVAANTPIQLDATRQSETQATARYQAGLAPILDVADAQSLLAQAEAQDALARIDVWRALLAAAVARGDVTPFLAALRVP